MNFKNLKYQILITLFPILAFSKPSQLESIHIESLANGIVLNLEMDSIPALENFTAWQANSNWFYITLYQVSGDSSKLALNKLPKNIQNYQVIISENSIQLGLQLYEPVDNHEFSSSEDDNFMVASLYYSSEYLSQLETIKDMDLSQKWYEISSKFRDWLYITGTGLTATGMIKDSNNRMNSQTQIGLSLLAITYMFDKIWS